MSELYRTHGKDYEGGRLFHISIKTLTRSSGVVGISSFAAWHTNVPWRLVVRETAQPHM